MPRGSRVRYLLFGVGPEVWHVIRRDCTSNVASLMKSLERQGRGIPDEGYAASEVQEAC